MGQVQLAVYILDACVQKKGEAGPRVTPTLISRLNIAIVAKAQWAVPNMFF